MEIDPKLLTSSGKKKVKKILSECGPPDYSGLAWSDFQKGEDYYKFLDKDYYKFLDKWNTHKVLREFFDGSGIEENDEYECGFDNLSYNEVTIYTNIAKIIISLRNQIEDAAETAGRVSRRLDGDWD
jgi:hypothetical protein